MSIEQRGAGGAGGRLSPADVQSVTFSRSTMLHPGYSDAEVDRFLDRVGDELTQLQQENAALQEQLADLQARLESVESRPAPGEQAMGILAAAQQTADQYVAEAEAFSRVMTSEAREQYEGQLRDAREKAGAIIQAAQEAATGAVAADAESRPADPNHPDAEALQRQVVYLQAFGQACRVQLRSYLEALLTDVETEWGRATPEALPQPPLRSPAPPNRPAVEAAPAESNGAAPTADASATDREPNVVKSVSGPQR
ncbi:DivIVA domain-containing protein [Modestobacter lapidis]|nr:DivIVA domain-containing protein [Modestobacter lapidis]